MFSAELTLKHLLVVEAGQIEDLAKRHDISIVCTTEEPGQFQRIEITLAGGPNLNAFLHKVVDKLV